MGKNAEDDKILERINFLNSKQRDIVDVIYNWAKIHAKQKGVNVEPLDILISGSTATGKLHLLRILYNAISKTLLFNYENRESTKIEGTFTVTNRD